MAASGATHERPQWAICRDDYLAFHRIPKYQSIVVQRRGDVPFYFGKAKGGGPAGRIS